MAQRSTRLSLLPETHLLARSNKWKCRFVRAQFEKTQGQAQDSSAPLTIDWAQTGKHKPAKQ